MFSSNKYLCCNYYVLIIRGRNVGARMHVLVSRLSRGVGGLVVWACICVCVGVAVWRCVLVVIYVTCLSISEQLFAVERG